MQESKEVEEDDILETDYDFRHRRDAFGRWISYQGLLSLTASLE